VRFIKIGIIFIIFHPHDGESIAQAWGRLKSLMLKCPIHEHCPSVGKIEVTNSKEKILD
jgi:hypothetical protein